MKIYALITSDYLDSENFSLIFYRLSFFLLLIWFKIVPVINKYKIMNQNIITILESISNNEFYVSQLQNEKYTRIKDISIFDFGELKETESRLIFEIFGEFPLSEENLIKWNQIKGAFNETFLFNSKIK